MVSEVGLESPMLRVVGDFNMHTTTDEDETAQGFWAAMTTFALS